MNLKILKNKEIPIEQYIEVYRNSEINRPFNDIERMKAMLLNSNLIISAWDHDKIIGLARCFIDYGWVCYLSDLLVDVKYQKLGVGKELIDRVRIECGDNCQLVLLSAPTAMEYYPKVGFEYAKHAFIIKRNLA